MAAHAFEENKQELKKDQKKIWHTQYGEKVEVYWESRQTGYEQGRS